MSAGRFSAGTGERRVEADLVARLRRLPVGEAPDERFKAELRSQLVAITPRIVAESPPVASGPAGRPERPGRLIAFRRPLIAFSSAATVLMLLLGLAVWMANGALPGQSLYGIKRASENFQLSVAGSDTSRGLKYLKFASGRAQEAGKLAGSAQADPHTAALIASTLRSADSDTRSGARLLDSSAVSQVSADPLTKATGWLVGQRARIAALAPQLPAGPARSQAAASLALLQQVAVRVSQLKAELGCACLSQANADDLGPLPCPSCLAKRPNLPGGAPGTSGLPSLPTDLPGPSSALPTTPSLPGLGGPGGSGSGGSGSSGGALPPGGLPSQAPGLPGSPASGGTGGVSVSLPGLGISAGSGGLSVSASLPRP
ncbi:MAG: DUF5667 domain-containing protein [Jatrophihabitantaceae bacterium]